MFLVKRKNPIVPVERVFSVNAHIHDRGADSVQLPRSMTNSAKAAVIMLHL